MAGSPPVSQAELAKLIAKAVEKARARHKDLELTPALFDSDAIRIPWWIVGRVARGPLDLDKAYKVAEDIAQATAPNGPVLQPVAMKLGKEILVGFIERYGRQFEPPIGSAPGEFGP